LDGAQIQTDDPFLHFCHLIIGPVMHSRLLIVSPVEDGAEHP
jgi:hypothetical protein